MTDAVEIKAQEIDADLLRDSALGFVYHHMVFRFSKGESLKTMLEWLNSLNWHGSRYQEIAINAAHHLYREEKAKTKPLKGEQ
jgi:hypothetical protein